MALLQASPQQILHLLGYALVCRPSVKKSLCMATR